MTQNSYRIFKLRSGEQIVAEIKSSSSKKFKVRRPMSIRSAMQFDGRGRQKEFTVLRDWLNYSDEMDTEIPKDFIVTIIKPTSQMITLYEREKELEDEPQLPNEIIPISGMDDLKSFIDKELEKTIKEELESLEDEDTDIKDAKEEMMVMSLAFPIDVLQKMIDAGILDKEDFSGINFNPDDATQREKISDEYTPDGDGETWTDWSHNRLYYLKDNEDEEES